MNNKIMIVIHSYKNKKLLEYVDKILNSAKNKSSIKIKLYDQINVSRRESFKNIKNLEYTHVRWDDYRGPNHYRARALQETSKFVLFLSDHIDLTSHWDEKLIDAMSDNSVISMSGKEHISWDSFFITVDRESSSTMTKSFFVNMDMLFMPQHLAYIILQLQQFKVSGLSEAVSVKLFSKGVDVFSMPTDFLTDSKHSTDIDYYPYSKTHNYSKLYNVLLSEPGKLFCNAVGIDTSKIKRYPYEINNPEYSDARSLLDEMPSGSKFNSIHQKITFIQKK